MSNLNSALKYAQLGLRIFPCRPLEKIPAIKGWQLEATSNVEQIRKWWMQLPQANIGILLGDKLSAIDLDHGLGEDELKKFPPTVTVKTPNGFHLYFQFDARLEKHDFFTGSTLNNQGAYIRGRDQYVLAPGSKVRQADGSVVDYKFYENGRGELNFELLAPAELPLPAWFTTPVIEPRVNLPPPAPEEKKSAPAGKSAHDFLVRDIATKLRHAGKTIDEIGVRLLEEQKKINDVRKISNKRLITDDEIRGILKWVETNIIPDMPAPDQTETETKERRLYSLGHYGDNYFYTSTDNRFIIEISSVGHVSKKLLTLMPYTYWLGFSPDGNGGINWTQAADKLMQECRTKGVWNSDSARGTGAWYDNKRIILHTGQSLFVDGKELNLNELPNTKYLYVYEREIDKPANREATLEECKKLLEACQAVSWREPLYGKLMFGWLMLAHISGALKWKPMIWVVGEKGQGKTEFYQRVVKELLGNNAEYFGLGSTAAGVRQRLKCNSTPILFDDIDTREASGRRCMEGILEIARTSSSSNDEFIRKGTSDQKGMSFKNSSSFYLSSTRLLDLEEQDKSRWSIFEIKKHDRTKWPQVKLKYDATRGLGVFILNRVLSRYNQIRAAIKLIEDVLAERESRRTAQQLAPMIAGYYIGTSNIDLTLEAARDLCKDVDPQATSNDENDEASDSQECLNTILDTPIRWGQDPVKTDMIRTLICAVLEQAEGPIVNDRADALLHYGILVKKNYTAFHYGNRQFKEIYTATRWERADFIKIFLRLPGATKERVFFNRAIGQQRCVTVPNSFLFPDNFTR